MTKRKKDRTIFRVMVLPLLSITGGGAVCVGGESAVWRRDYKVKSKRAGYAGTAGGKQRKLSVKC